MKIVFLARSLLIGGAERQLVLLAKGLQQMGHSVIVALFYSGGPLEKELDQANVPVVGLEKQGRWDVLGFMKRLIGFLKREQPDLIHSYLTVPNILAVLAKPFVPGIPVVWGVRASNMELQEYDWTARLMYSMERRLSRFPNLIITNSQSGLQFALNNGFPNQTGIVIPNGIDTERFRLDPSAGQSLRAIWGLSGREKVVGLVARLDPIKDHSTFLRAASILAQDRPEVRFVCIGDGPARYREQLRAMGEDLGLGERLIWMGPTIDMPRVYNALDILVLSSLGEGFPNVLGESMACGVPAVTTDIGDAAWIVGDTGIVVPPRNPGELARGMNRMFDRLSREPSLKDQARLRIVQNFNRERLIAQTANELGKVSGSKGVRL